MDLVELLRTSNQFEAEVITARLRDAGVQAVVFAAGWASHLAPNHGQHRVMVPEDALDFSRELLSQEPLDQ